MKYPRNSSFFGVFSEWVDKNRTLLASMTECEIRIYPGSGMVKQEAVITLTDDGNEFETNWKYSKSTFPCRVKALAKVMQEKGMRGTFSATQYDDVTKIKRV